jgi:hypothetical protein
VTGVKQVYVGVAPEGMDNASGSQNPAGERAKKLELKPSQPVMSFLMTLYYLP